LKGTWKRKQINKKSVESAITPEQKLQGKEMVKMGCSHLYNSPSCNGYRLQEQKITLDQILSTQYALNNPS
jgi:hypothetical protein